MSFLGILDNFRINIIIYKAKSIKLSVTMMLMLVNIALLVFFCLKNAFLLKIITKKLVC
jgi:hypothetical protein